MVSQTVVAALDEGEFYTLPVPATTRAERYIREWIPSLWEHQYILRKAYIDQRVELVVLVPQSDLDDELADCLNGGQVLGEPTQVVDGITEPMIGYRLKRMAIPE